MHSGLLYFVLLYHQFGPQLQQNVLGDIGKIYLYNSYEDLYSESYVWFFGYNAVKNVWHIP